jgi:dipeptidyl aminopeptidase/acylaminoacyl peptidase
MTIENHQQNFSVARFLNARAAQLPAFSPDGRSVAFVTDMTGIQQLWQVSVDGGWPEQLTFTDDRVMLGLYGHHAPDLVFGMDNGGDERQQIFRLRAGVVTEIDVDPAVMHAIGVISKDDRHVAFSSNRRHLAHFDVYVANLDGSNVHCVYEQDGSNFVADWSADGRFLLLMRRTGSLDSELILLDLESGEATHLTPHTSPVMYTHGQFSPDGRTIFFTTDAASEFARVARMDLDDHQITYLSDDTADVDWLRLSPDGRLLAIIRNHDGYGQLSILDLARDQEIPAPDLPEGVPMEPAWSGDSRRVAFGFTSPTHNANIWIWDVEAAMCRQITHVAQGGIPRETFVAPELIRYPTFDGREIPAFLYLPRVERPPVVVVVHGGPEAQKQPIFDPVTQFFVNHGYAVFAPNVRGSTGYGRTYTHLDDVEKRMDSVADLEAAARWLKASGRVDGNRLAIMGGSYGGFMVLAAVTTYPDLWSAGVDIVGIANFETFLRNTSAYRRHWRIPEYGDPDRDAALLHDISPITHMDRMTAPLFVVHGDNDPRVPLSETEQVVEEGRRRGVPVEMLRFVDEGHGVVKLANKLVAYHAIAAFLDRYL